MWAFKNIREALDWPAPPTLIRSAEGTERSGMAHFRNEVGHCQRLEGTGGRLWLATERARRCPACCTAKGVAGTWMPEERRHFR